MAEGRYGPLPKVKKYETPEWTAHVGLTYLEIRAPGEVIRRLHDWVSERELYPLKTMLLGAGHYYALWRRGDADIVIGWLEGHGWFEDDGEAEAWRNRIVLGEDCET